MNPGCLRIHLFLGDTGLNPDCLRIYLFLGDTGLNAAFATRWSSAFSFGADLIIGASLPPFGVPIKKIKLLGESHKYLTDCQPSICLRTWAGACGYVKNREMLALCLPVLPQPCTCSLPLSPLPSPLLKAYEMLVWSGSSHRSPF